MVKQHCLLPGSHCTLPSKGRDHFFTREATIFQAPVCPQSPNFPASHTPQRKHEQWRWSTTYGDRSLGRGEGGGGSGEEGGNSELHGCGKLLSNDPSTSRRNLAFYSSFPYELRVRSQKEARERRGRGSEGRVAVAAASRLPRMTFVEFILMKPTRPAGSGTFSSRIL